MIKAVIIDLDETLVLTEAVCFDLENEVLRRMGRPPMSRAIHRSTWGRALLEAIPDRSPGVNVAAFQRQYPPVKAEYVQTERLDVIPEAHSSSLKHKVDSLQFSPLALMRRRNIY